MPKGKNSFFKNWSFLIVSDVSQKIISFLVFMFLARKLSPEGYGVLNSILALAAIFSVFATNVSANQVITREVTLHPTQTKSIFRIVFFIRIISLLVSIGALIIYLIHTGENSLSYIVATSMIVASTLLWDFSETIAFGHFTTKFTTYISIASSISWFVVVLLLPRDSITVEMVIMFYSAIFMIRSFVYFGVSYLKFARPNTDETSLTVKNVLGMSFPYLWMRIVGTLGNQVPILLLKGYSGAAEVGYFAVGSRFVLPITLAVQTGLKAVFPFMTKMYQNDKEKFNQRLATGFTYILILGSSIAMVLTLTSKYWLPALFGTKYMDAIIPFNYQAWFGVILSFDLMLATVLSSSYKQKTLSIITTIDILIIFPLMYLGSKYGAEGMAIAKLAGAIITVTYHVVIIILVLKTKLRSWSFFLSAIYFISMMCIILLIDDFLLKLILIVGIIVIYFIFKESPLRKLFKMVSNRVIKYIKGRTIKVQ